MYEYTTITIDLTGQGGTGVDGTLYAELFHTVTLANNDTVPPRKYSATVTTGAGSLVLPCTATAIKGTNAPFKVTFIPTSGAEVTLGRIIPTESASAVQLSDLLEVGATSAVPVTTYNVGNTTLSIAPSRAALAAMGGLTDGDRVLVTAIGIYRYAAASAATADDATIITPANGVGRWLLEIPSVAGTPFITPELFGAVGDGTTDDTTALQAAINASSDTGATVMLGPNAYAFTRLTLKSGMSIVGAGQLASQLICTDSTTLDAGVAWGSALRRADDGADVFYVRIENLAILSSLNGSGIAASQTTFANVMGLNLAGCGYSHIQNVTVQGFGQAGIVLARCEGGTEGLGFTGTTKDGNYNSFFNVRAQGNGSYRTVTHTAHTITGNTNSNTTIDGISTADMARLRIGDAISGSGIPAGATVATLASSTSITISAAATATASAITLTTARSQGANVLLLYKANSNKIYSLYSKGGIPTQAITGDLLSASKTVGNVSAADIAKLVIGQYLSAASGIANLTQVETIGATSFTMSIAATATVAATEITQSRAATGFAILHGNDNLLSGATFESIGRGAWFGTNALGNLVQQPRAEGLFDALFTSSPTTGTPQGGGGNIAFGDYFSSGGTRLDIANNGEFRYVASQYNSLRSGRFATTSLSTNIDNHLVDALGVLSGSDGIFYAKAPGYDSTQTVPFIFQIHGTVLGTASGDTLGEIRAFNNDSSTDARGANAVMRFKTFDSGGTSGISFRAGKAGAPAELLELNTHARIVGGAWDAGSLGLGTANRIWVDLNADWQPSTFYAATAVRKNGSNLYTCMTKGITATSGGPTGTGTGITDGTAVWDYLSGAPAATTGRLRFKTSAPSSATDGDRIFTSLTGSATFNPPSLATLTTSTTTVTVTGAAIGDFASVSHGISLGGLMVTAYVSAADTVTVVLFNPTAGTIDIGSSTLRVKVDRN